MGAQLGTGVSAFESGGTIVAYEVRGSGSPAIVVPFLEGFDRAALRAIFRPLEAVLTLAYFDPPGVGGSGPPPGPDDRSPSRMIRDLEALRARSGVRSVGLVAHGSGARIAIAFAAGHVANIAFLILSGASAANEFEPGDPSPFDDESIAVAWNAARRQPTVEAFSAWHRAMRSVEPRSPLISRAFARIERLVASADPERLPLSERQLAGLDVRPLLRLVAAPTLVVAGGRDAVVPARWQRNLAKALPRATLVEFPRSGHYPLVQEPEAFLRAVRSFLRDRTRIS